MEPNLIIQKALMNLFELQKEGILCDLELCGDDGSVKIHRVILAAYSRVFSLAYSHNKSLHNLEKCLMRGVPGHLLPILVKYFYTGTLDIETAAAARTLKNVASQLQINDLTSLCNGYLDQGGGRDPPPYLDQGGGRDPPPCLDQGRNGLHNVIVKTETPLLVSETAVEHGFTNDDISNYYGLENLNFVEYSSIPVNGDDGGIPAPEENNDMKILIGENRCKTRKTYGFTPANRPQYQRATPRRSYMRNYYHRRKMKRALETMQKAARSRHTDVMLSSEDLISKIVANVKVPLSNTWSDHVYSTASGGDDVVVHNTVSDGDDVVVHSTVSDVDDVVLESDAVGCFQVGTGLKSSVLTESEVEERKDDRFNTPCNNVQQTSKKRHTRQDSPCEWCGVTFMYKDSMRDHYRFKHPDKMIKCDICPRLFCTYADKHDHWILCAIKNSPKVGGKYKCPACDYTQKREYFLKKHYLARHVEQMSFQCEQCDKQYLNHNNYAEHCLQIHDTVTEATHSRALKLYVCNWDGCEFRTYVSKKLVEHKEMSHMGKTFLCDVCGVDFTSSSKLTNHRNQVHKYEFICGVEGCRYRATTKATFINHQYTIHKIIAEGTDLFVCSECTFSSTRQQTVQNHHVAVHQTIRPHACNTCGKAFKTKFALATHSRSHENIRNYPCDQCNYSAITLAGLKMHKDFKHSAEKQFQCAFCSYRSATKGNLKKHLKSCSLKHGIPELENVDLILEPVLDLPVL